MTEDEFLDLATTLKIEMDKITIQPSRRVFYDPKFNNIKIESALFDDLTLEPVMKLIKANGLNFIIDISYEFTFTLEKLVIQIVIFERPE